MKPHELSRRGTGVGAPRERQLGMLHLLINVDGRHVRIEK